MISKKDLNFRTYRDFKKFCAKLFRKILDPKNKEYIEGYYYSKKGNVYTYFNEDYLFENLFDELTNNIFLYDNRFVIYNNLMNLYRKSKNIRFYIDDIGGPFTQEEMDEIKVDDPDNNLVIVIDRVVSGMFHILLDEPAGKTLLRSL